MTLDEFNQNDYLSRLFSEPPFPLFVYACTYVYIETSIIRTPLGPPLTVLFMEVEFLCSHVDVSDVRWDKGMVSC